MILPSPDIAVISILEFATAGLKELSDAGLISTKLAATAAPTAERCTSATAAAIKLPIRDV
jgi:hypothetical protein